jgi:hypothetical protein
MMIAQGDMSTCDLGPGTRFAHQAQYLASLRREEEVASILKPYNARLDENAIAWALTAACDVHFRFCAVPRRYPDSRLHDLQKPRLFPRSHGLRAR